MNYGKYRRKLEKTYEDRCTIKKWEKTKVNGETKFDWVAKVADIPCRISQKALGTNGQTETTNNISYETKLFISPEIEFVQGELWEVTRGRNTDSGWEPLGSPRNYDAGEPFVYQTHQEISLQRKDKA